jgi:predicted nuclease of predicted toxin-antitoxin system
VRERVAKFLLDENIPISTIELFKNKGHDVIHTRTQGLTGLPDDRIMEIANRDGLIIITRDLDFGNLLDYPINTHQGIIVLRLPDTYTAKQINKVLEAFLSDVSIAEIEKALVVIDPSRYRIRRE